MDDTGNHEDDEYLCIVMWRTRTKRLIHWHWPRSGVLACRRAAEAAQEHLYQ